MTTFRRVIMENNVSYMIIKPDGVPLINTLISEMQDHGISVISKFEIQDYDDLFIHLYLDSDAIERGNTPIIIGINKIYNRFYGDKPILLIIKSDFRETKNDFIVRVCKIKKALREKYFGKYRMYEIEIFESDYDKYNLKFSEYLALKRAIGQTNRYQLQINGIHSPDDINAYNREIDVLKKHTAYKKI